MSHSLTKGEIAANEGSTGPRPPTSPEGQPAKAAIEIRPWPPILAKLPGGAFLWRYGVVLLAVAFFAGYSLKFLRDDSPSEWRTCYMQASQQMLAGDQIYRIGNYCYAYPPAMALYGTPLAHLPAEVSLGIWYLVNVLATCVVFWCAWQLVGGPRLQGLNRAWTLVLWLVLLVAARHLLSPLENRQTDMCIAAFIMWGVWRLARGRDLSAAVSLGLAASMKLTPLLFGPYLVWRGKWRAALVLGTVCLGVNLLPDFLLPQQSGRWYLAEWHRVFFQESSARVPGEWVSNNRTDKNQLNQSLSGLVLRYSRYGLATPDSEPLVARGEPDRVSPRTVRAITYAAALALLVGTLWFSRRAGKLKTAAAGGQESELVSASWQTAIEGAAVCCLMLLLSPMTSKAHYAILFLPALVIVRGMVLERDRLLAVFYALLLVAGPFTAKGVVGKYLGDTLALWGVPTYFPLLCLAGMWLLLTRIGAARSLGSLAAGGEAGDAGKRENRSGQKTQRARPHRARQYRAA